MTFDTIHPRVLITGSGGQLGSELCRLLGCDAFGLDLPDLDITHRESVCDAVNRVQPDVVINAAAFTHVDQAEREPERCRAVNVRGVENLVSACQASGSSLVQISTDYVFDGRQRRPYLETDRPNPLNAYGRAKWEAEQVVAQYPRHLIVRTAGLFGYGGPTAAGNFVDTMLRLAVQGRPLRIVNDQISSFTYAGDLAKAVRTLLSSRATGLFHLTNMGSASWYQLAAEVFRISGLHPKVDPISMAKYRRDAERPRFSVLNTEKYAGTPSHFPMPSWQEAVSAYLDDRRDRSHC